MIVNHNIPAMNANRQMGINNNKISKSLEKLSSGLGINRAADNAAGLAISEKMRGQISGLDQATSNSEDGISLSQTAEGALNETTSILQRMRELSVQSANGTYQDDVDRENIQTEIKSLKSEVDRISTSTHYNGIKLLDGTSSAGNVTYGKVESTTTAQAVEHNVVGAAVGATAKMSFKVKDEAKFKAAFGDDAGDISKIQISASAESAAAGTITLSKADGTSAVALTALKTDAAITGTSGANALTAAQQKALEDAGIDASSFTTDAGIGVSIVAATDTAVTEKVTAATIASSGTAGTLFAAAATDGTGVQLMFDGKSTLKNGDYTLSYDAQSQYIKLCNKSTGEEVDSAKVGSVINAGDQIKFGKTGTTLRFGSATLSTTANALSGSTDVSFYQASTGRHAVTGSNTAVIPNGTTAGVLTTEFGASDVGAAATVDQLSIDFGATDALNGYSIKFMGNSEAGVAAEVDKDAKTITIKLDTAASTTANTAKAVQDALKAQSTSLGVKADDIKVTGAGTWVGGTTLAKDATQTLTVGLGIDAGAKSATTTDLSTTVDFTASSFKAGSTVSVGSKTYELVKNGEVAKTAGAEAIAVSDFDDKESIVKSIASKASQQPDVLVTSDKNVMTIQNTAKDAKEATKVSLDEMGGVTFQIGANGVKDQRVTLSVQDQSSKGLGIANIDCSTQTGANAAIDVIDDAINSVSGTRADLGALQNRMEHTINSLGVASENLTAAESRIRDVDMAAEMMEFTKNQILSQASQAMLAQANTLPQGVLQLLQ